MCSILIKPDQIYAKDSNLKKQDVEILLEWLKKQPHLPAFAESQLLIVLHSCHYSVETSKKILENFATVRGQCPEIFLSLTPETIKSSLEAASINILPRRTSDDSTILLIKLRDFKPEHFNCTNFVNLINMVSSLEIHQNGPLNGVALFDAQGVSLGHLGRVNLNIVKFALFYVQEAIPLRIKGVHIINPIPLVDKLLFMLKPFLKSELINMIQFHPSYESLHAQIPPECLPKDYNGLLSSTEDLHNGTLKHLLDCSEFFQWHDKQFADENKRTGTLSKTSKSFGTEGTFKKLEID